jgi:Type IV secretion system pilin
MARKLAFALCLGCAAALLAPQAADAATTLNQVISNLQVWLLGLLGALSTLLLVIGGIRYGISVGDPAGQEKAKQTIKAALIGYAVAILAPVIVTVAGHIVGA